MNKHERQVFALSLAESIVERSDLSVYRKIALAARVVDPSGQRYKRSYLSSKRVLKASSMQVTLKEYGILNLNYLLPRVDDGYCIEIIIVKAHLSAIRTGNAAALKSISREVMRYEEYLEAMKERINSTLMVAGVGLEPTVASL